MMKPAQKDFLNIVFWVGLGGLMMWGYHAATSKQAEKAVLGDAVWEHKKAGNIAVVNAGPKTKVSQTPEGTVIELTIPSSTMGGLSVQFKRCVIWRDKTSATSAMSCDSDTASSYFESGDEPDNSPPYRF